MKTIITLMVVLVLVLCHRLSNMASASKLSSQTSMNNEHDAWDHGFMMSRMGYSYSDGKSSYVKIISKYHDGCTNCLPYVSKKEL